MTTVRHYDVTDPRAPMSLSEARIVATARAKEYIRKVQMERGVTVLFREALDLVLDADPALRSRFFGNPEGRFEDPRQATR